MLSLIFSSLQVFSSEAIISNINHHTSEVTFSKPVSRAIYYRLNVAPKEADLVHGLMFKNSRYLFCAREPDLDFHCHFYFKDISKGSISSYYEDRDYGKGDPITFITTKSMNSKSSLKISKNTLNIYFEDKLAKKLFLQLDQGEIQYFGEGEKLLEKRIGKNMSCIFSDYINKYSCILSISLNDQEKKLRDTLILE